MRLAFCLFRYFPFGGVQRNFLRIAELCAQRGHDVYLFTLRWDGPPPTFNLHTHIAPVSAWRNHHRYEQFAEYVKREIDRETFHLVIGFNKMPGLDVYYAGDPCFMEGAHSRRGALYRLSGRFRHFSEFERAVFARDAATRILLIAENQKEHFQKWYGTADERFFLLPPYVSRDRAKAPPCKEARAQIRNELDLDEADNILLMVGSDYRRKGVARSIRAIAALPIELRRRTHLLVVGNGRAWPYLLLAKRLGVGDRVHLLGGRSDVPTFLAAADVLLHPAVEENTGTAIVEAIVAGLPVLATANCGYANHVVRAGAGCIVESPFQQARLDELLREMLTPDHRESWRAAALRYAQETDLFSRPERAVELIESFGREPAAARSEPTDSQFAVSSPRA